MEDSIDKIGEELEDARRTLHQTVTELRNKIETTTTQLAPTHMVIEHLSVALSISAVLGFMVGNSAKPGMTILLLGSIIAMIKKKASVNGNRIRGFTPSA